MSWLLQEWKKKGSDAQFVYFITSKGKILLEVFLPR